MRDFRRYAVVPWLIAIGTLFGAYSAAGLISLRVPRLILLVIGAGILFVGVALHLRRFGTMSLITWAVTVGGIGSVALGGIAADALGVPGWEAWIAGSCLVPGLLAASLWLHWRGNPARPALERDFPSALAAFGVGLWIGFVTLVVVLVLVTPRIG